MRRSKLIFQSLLLVALSLIISQPVFPKSEGAKDSKQPVAKPIIWRNPGNMSRRDLRYGSGAPELAPVGPFKFLKEAKNGESPKFVIRDARGDEWTVKLGPEAQAETVSTRLVWAVGYFAEEAYYFAEVRIDGLPRLSRGQEFVSGDIVRGARFEPERSNMKSGSSWDWRKNPFADTQELNGLKVLMILLNNFDAHSGNNRIIYVSRPRGTEARYYVTDLGATLGRAGGSAGLERKISRRFPVHKVRARCRYARWCSGIRLRHKTKRWLNLLSVLHPIYYRHEVNKEKAMRGIPVSHARSIGSLLSQLSDEQLTRRIPCC